MSGTIGAISAACTRITTAIQTAAAETGCQVTRFRAAAGGYSKRSHRNPYCIVSIFSGEQDTGS